MGWSPLASQFCFELAFGVLFALAFVPRAPVGVLFYRVMGGAALVPLLVAFLAPPMAEAGSWTSAPGVAALIAALAYVVYGGPFRGVRWALGLGVGLAATVVGVALLLWGQLAGPGAFLLALLTSLATGAVAGSVGLAMVLGHWYLTVDKLDVAHLRRLNKVTIASMLTSLVLVGLSCSLQRAHMDPDAPALFGPTGMFYVGSRTVVGLLMPLLFAAMTAGCLGEKNPNTRSATGILYASTVLVLIGAAAAISLQDAFGVPL